jgi:hypothetical protein
LPGPTPPVGTNRTSGSGGAEPDGIGQLIPAASLARRGARRAVTRACLVDDGGGDGRAHRREMAMSTEIRPGSAAVERVPAKVILRDSTRAQ